MHAICHIDTDRPRQIGIVVEYSTTSVVEQTATDAINGVFNSSVAMPCLYTFHHQVFRMENEPLRMFNTDCLPHYLYIKDMRSFRISLYVLNSSVSY